MTKADLIESLKDVPDDAEIVAWDPDQGGFAPVTGIVHGPPLEESPFVDDVPGCRVCLPPSHYSSGGEQRDFHTSPWTRVVEICTDDNS